MKRASFSKLPKGVEFDELGASLRFCDFDAKKDKSIARLSQLLEKASASGGMSFLEMEGFLYGVTSLPGDISIIDLLPFILEAKGTDMEEEAVPLLVDEELIEAAELVMWWWEYIQGYAERKDFLGSPWICREEQLADVTREDAAVWSHGYLSALSQGGALDRILVADGAYDFLVPALMLAKNELPVEEDSPRFGQPLTDEEFDKALTLLPVCISALYGILRSPLVKKAKISRNDPCPCGSGKKYKKCCLEKEPA